MDHQSSQNADSNTQQISPNVECNTEQLLQQAVNQTREIIYLYLENGSDNDARIMATEMLEDFLTIGSQITPSILMTTLTVLQAYNVVDSEFVDNTMKPFLIHVEITIQ